MKATVIGDKKLNDKIMKAVRTCENPTKPMTQSVMHLQNKLADYPGQGANITGYVRTGTLGRRWTTEVSHGGKRGKVGNNTSYAHWVQSGEMQAWMHVGRWKTDQKVADDERKVILQFFVDAIVGDMT